MTPTTKYLDLCKKQLGIESDYALAKALDTTVQRISNYRNERANADAEICLKIGEILDVDPLQVMGDILKESARTPKGRELWKKYSSAAALLLALLPLCGKCELLQVSTNHFLHNGSIVYKGASPICA